MSEEKLKVAVVGLGKMGLVHSGILNVMPNVQLTAVCEKSRLIRRFAKKIIKDVSVVDDVRKLSEFDIDLVYVTTPIPSHFVITQTICSERIAQNIFVEKTLARNYDEARKLCELVGNSVGVNMVGYLRRFYVTFRKAKDLLTQEAIGRVSSFKAYAYSSDFLGNEKTLSAGSALRGGLLSDLGCHAIDLALWFFGDLQVNSTDHKSLGNGDSGKPARFQVMRSDGLVGDFEVSWCMGDYRMAEVGFSIDGSKGVIEVNDDRIELKLNTGETFVWYRHDLNDNVPFWLGLPEYYREDLHFIRSVIEKHDAEPDFYDASKVDKIISWASSEMSEHANSTSV
jgi:predicted dehydrogenase